MKTPLFILLSAQAVLALMLSGCEHCYRCEQYQYCVTFNTVCLGDSETFTLCETTAYERQLVIADVESNPNCTSVTYTENDILVIGSRQEVCEKKKEAEDAVYQLESQGFQCQEQ